MTFALRTDGAWTAVPYGTPVTNGDGIQASHETLLLWSEDEREAFGVFAVAEPDPPPEGKEVASRELVGEDRPAWKVEYRDAPAPAVPESVTNYQARAALIGAGLFDKANAAVRGSSDPIAVQAWDYANQFYRNSPIITALAGGLGLKDAQIDDLFRTAAKVI